MCVCVSVYMFIYICIKFTYIGTPFLTHEARIFAYINLFISFVKKFIISRVCVDKLNK